MKRISSVSRETIIFILLALEALVIVALVSVVFNPSEHRLRELHYKTETAALVSPHSLREHILHGQNFFVIVDTRDRDSYIRGHIVGALNIEPGDFLVEDFKALQEEYKNKPILIYCYTQVCMRGRKIGKELARNGIYVQELGIGFNEWKNFWREWNYENEWDEIDIQDYITVGEDPGVFEDVIPRDVFMSSCSSTPGFEC